MRPYPLAAISLLYGLLIAATAVTAEIPPGMARATFVVHCYDVGAGAIDGEPGVISVERGWSGGREVDRVIYDPQLVTLGQLENRLREADTYVGTLEVQHKHTVPAEQKMSQ